MLDEFSNEEDQGSIFESFSDIALCTLAVALLLVTLLAMSMSQVNVQINRSTFSGGVMRPSLHMECTVPDFGETTDERYAVERTLFAGRSYVAVHLFSPSLALIATDVREGGTVALGEDETFAQQQDLSLYQFMQLAPGIDPGSFEAEGQATALLLPSILDKQMVYEPSVIGGYRVNADRLLTKRLMAALWPIYANPTYPVRRPEEYSKARTRVLVETQVVSTPGGEEDYYIVIGHSAYKLPEALDDGSLAWLGGFSSGLTEIVYLGETWSDSRNHTNKRIQFLDQHGMDEAADAYRSYAFPEPLRGSEYTELYAKLVESGCPEERIEERVRLAMAQLNVSEALLDGSLPVKGDTLFPPLLAFPDEWAAYVAYYENEQPDAPSWFYREFLDRLGFDRLTIEGSSL
ncbi:MAG: hypothetical protein V3V05_06230 [Pontiella sp.]